MLNRRKKAEKRILAFAERFGESLAKLDIPISELENQVRINHFKLRLLRGRGE